MNLKKNLYCFTSTLKLYFSRCPIMLQTFLHNEKIPHVIHFLHQSVIKSYVKKSNNLLLTCVCTYNTDSSLYLIKI